MSYVNSEILRVKKKKGLLFLSEKLPIFIVIYKWNFLL